ncbi:MAG: amidohydrolase family protein [Nitrospiraceae bacterium]|nr:amidohydrolase family protein [Nitrospirota bacterium]MDA8340265.1 amidohydrolase family protein [Nitrospiraceae bacterium]
MQKIIDIHTHGIGGYDTRTTVEDHILKIAEIQGSHGVSEIIPTIYPATIKVMRENMATIKKAMELQKTEDRSQKTESRIIGVHLEGPFLNPSKCGALNAITFIDPTEDNLKELIEGFEDMVKIITIAPEINGATKLIKKITDTGIIASMGHSDATYAEAEAGFNAGAIGITHIFNAMRGFHHREPGIAGFGLLNQDIYIEVIADPYHLHSKTLELIFKTKNHNRIIIVSDSVKEATPFTKSQGVTDAHGKLLGGCMTIAESSKRLIEIGFDENIIMKCISGNPERYLNIVMGDE